MAVRVLESVIQVLLTAAAVGGAAGARAEGCALIGRGPSEVRTATGLPVDLPAPRVADCSGLRVVKGAVVACVALARNRSACKTFAAGQSVALGAIPNVFEAEGPWYTLGEILRGSPGAVKAVSRGGKDRALPTGSVLLLDAVAIAPDFDHDASLRGIQNIEIFAGGIDGPVIATLHADGERTVPTARLQPGQRYGWRISPPPGDLPVEGEFTVLPESERRLARAESEHVRRAAAGDVGAEAVMWAGWLASRGCAYEAAETLARAGFDVN